MSGPATVPPEPGWGVLVTGWEPGLVLVPLAVAGVGYGLAVRRLARRGRAWPAGRSVAFAGGLLAVAVATQSGLAAYDRVLFSLHAVQHVLLGMAAPLLLALGAPVTLALQASGRGTQRRLVRVLHSPPVRVLTHPLTAWVAFGGTLVVLYSTGLYEASLRDEWVHHLLHAHFVLAGSVFMAHVVALDPVPHALGYGARLLYVLVALPFHAFLGVAILTSDRVLAADWYGELARSWGSSALADQRTGAGLLWVAGEVFGVVAALLVAYRWMVHEQRVGARHDRRLPVAPAGPARPGRAT